MTKCPWERIDDFSSRSEFERCARWLQEQVDAGVAQVRQPQSRYIGSSTLEERWYEHIASGQTWRLVWPDPPFRGVFAPLD